MKRIVTLTLSPTIDVSSHVDRVVPERKLRCAEPLAQPGGGGVNVARVLARFGADPLAIFTAGGHTGQLLIELLERDGISTQPIAIAGTTRENVTIREDNSTLQYRFCMPGPSLSESERRRILDAISVLDPAPDYLVASGSLPPGLPVETYAELAHIANERGIRMILDTSGPPLQAALDAGIYMIKPNLSELAWLQGDAWIEDEEHLWEAAHAIVNDHDCHGVLVSLGAGGALAVTENAALRIPAPPVRPESKVGAGDSMVAGMVWGLAQDWTVLEAASLGVAAGAAAVMTPGSDLCHRGDAERLHAQMRERQQPYAAIS